MHFILKTDHRNHSISLVFHDVLSLICLYFCIELLCWSAQATITKHHRLCGFKKRKLFSFSSKCYKLQIKAPAESVPVKKMVHSALCAHMVFPPWCVCAETGLRERELMSPIQTQILQKQSPVLTASFNVNYFFRGSSPNTEGYSFHIWVLEEYKHSARNSDQNGQLNICFYL